MMILTGTSRKTQEISYNCELAIAFIFLEQAPTGRSNKFNWKSKAKCKYRCWIIDPQNKLEYVAAKIALRRNNDQHGTLRL